MGWKDFFFGKKQKKQPDPLKDLTLANLKLGYIVDYDLNTWQVEAYHYYDWGSGDISHEWQLKSASDTIYLEMEQDDEVEWSISRPIAIGRLGNKIIDHIRNHGDPPEQIVFAGRAYYLEEMGGGHFFENGKVPGKEMLSWDYEDDSGEHYLSIEQWGENDFQAFAGMPVEEYHFTNILPV